MDNYKRGTIVKVERDEELQCDRIWLERNNKSHFVINRYKENGNHVVGWTGNVPITGQEDDYISPKNGESYSCYTTKAKLKDTTTELKVDEAGDCTPTSFSTLSPTDLLHLSGNALILKALAPTCTIDQCVQSVVQLANDLKKQQ
tara:strand:+ start:830 stop:1264 length:435 start_codon:yes stop_codon:yes gene_type:complete